MMPSNFPLAFAHFAQQDFTSPYHIVLPALVAAGALVWLIAAILGFTRARAFGASTRWFAFSAACLVIYHIQLVVFALAFNTFGLNFGAFFNLFVVLAALCAIIGFRRLSDPR